MFHGNLMNLLSCLLFPNSIGRIETGGDPAMPVPPPDVGLDVSLYLGLCKPTIVPLFVRGPVSLGPFFGSSVRVCRPPLDVRPRGRGRDDPRRPRRGAGGPGHAGLNGPSRGTWRWGGAGSR